VPSEVYGLDTFGERPELDGVFAQDSIDRRCRKSKSFEFASQYRVGCGRKPALHTYQRGRAAIALTAFEFFYRVRGGLALDAFTNEFSDQPRVTDGFMLRLHIEARVEAIVDESVAFATFYGFANAVAVEPSSFQPFPELGFGQTAAR
jgi:hypothetical protein